MPDLVLHHNGMSSCSQKVRLVLAEKRLPFTSHEVNLVTGEQHAAERPAMLSQPPEVRAAALAGIPDPARRAARASVLEHGVAAPEFAGALGHYLDLLDAMEASLQPGAWLSGDHFGLADAAALPYVLRMDHMAMTPLFSGSTRPRVADWLARVKVRPSFETAITAWAPAPILNLFRTQGEAVWADVEPLTRHA